MKIRYITSQHSITGVREKSGKCNEDSFFIVQKKIKDGDIAIFAGVADGMGGLENGKEASFFVSEELKKWFIKHCDEIIKINKNDFCDKILKKIREIHQELRNKIQNEWNCKQAGSTLSLLYTRGTSYIIVNVGDSRIYLMQGNNILQITHDQTFAQHQIDEGVISEKDIDVSDKRMHMLMQAMGASEEIAPDFYIGKTGPYFTFFICSDGMINRVDSEEVKNHLINSEAKSEKEKIVNIMKLAMKRGETDNLTGMIIKKYNPEIIAEEPQEIVKPKKIETQKESQEPTGKL